MNKKIFITGANGFIGQKLVDFLVAKGFEVEALVRPGSVPGFSLQTGVKVIVGDLLDQRSLKMSKNATVINLAANPYHPVLSYKVNVEGTKNLLEVCRKMKVSLVVHVSSQATKIKNKGVYADSKSQSDELVKASRLRYVIIKPSLVYGDGEKGLFNKIKKLVTMIPVVPIFGNGEAKVNPITTDDFNCFVEAIVRDEKVNGEVFDLGSSKSISYNQLYSGILKEIESKAMMVHIPTWVGLLGGKVFQMLKMKNPPFFIDNVLGSTQETNCNPASIIKRYGIIPSNFLEGMKKVFEKEKVKVAVAGLGKMGLLHLSILSSMNDVKIVALIDSNPKLFPTIKSMGVTGNFYDDLKTALKSEKIDAVYVLTPTFTHLPLVEMLVKNKKDIFLEKPAVLNGHQLTRLTKITSGYSGVINVGYTLLFRRSYQQVKKIIDSGEYGAIKSFKVSFEHGEVLGKEKKGWMFNKLKSGGGVLMNPGPHIFSLINYFFGSCNKISGKTRRVYSLEVEDEANFVFDYSNFKGEVRLSWSVKNRDLPQTEIEIVFEKGALVTDGKKIRLVDSCDKKLIKENQIEPLLNEVLDINPQANGEAYYTEDRLFVEAVKKRTRRSINDLSFALKTESMIHKCYQSSKND